MKTCFEGQPSGLGQTEGVADEAGPVRDGQGGAVLLQQGREVGPVGRRVVHPVVAVLAGVELGPLNARRNGTEIKVI